MKVVSISTALRTAAKYFQILSSPWSYLGVPSEELLLEIEQLTSISAKPVVMK